MSEPLLLRLSRWAAGLRFEDLPEGVVEQAKNQVLSILAAVYSGFASDLGPRIAQAFPPPAPGTARLIPGGAAAPPSHAALVMAAWSMVLDFDDVMLGGHTGHSSVLVPLAHARAARASGARLLTAQVAANEVAARVNMVCAVGETRGQMATHLHLMGAALGRAHLEGLEAPTLAHALGFALAYPARALFPAFLGSDAKVMCAAWPVRMGIEAVDAARAGLGGPLGLLEDRRGFFAAHATVPVYDFLDGLGEQWHTVTNSFKVHPACGYISAVLDVTRELVARHRPDPARVARVEVAGSLFAVGMDEHSRPYLAGPASPISTLTFSTPYCVAWTLLDGELAPRHFTRAARNDPRAWALAERVRVRHDKELTGRALTGDIPVGAALLRIPRRRAAAFALALSRKAFGDRGRLGRWRSGLALALSVGRAAHRRPLDLAAMTKPLGARVTLHTTDGQAWTAAREIPVGFAGDGDWRSVRRLMSAKLLAAAGPVIGETAAEALTRGIGELERRTAPEVEDLLSIACGDGRGSPATPIPSTLVPS